ncbi:hypothetical protein [Sphingomonas sp.]|uniref:hypothetical protein n=1 Tax=Sphingomonas sp. TaxID=28214 RepID=UPI003AFFBEC2
MKPSLGVAQRPVPVRLARHLGDRSTVLGTHPGRLLLCCGAGGRDGQWAVFLLAASLLTIPATWFGQHWARTGVGVSAVDLGLLLGLYALALRSRRFFPIWMAGFHLIAVTTHLSTVLEPEITPRLYRAMESLWAIPITLAMVFGIALDRRAGIRT